MSVKDIIENIFLLLSGLGVFLFGLKVMGDNLENVAGSKLRILFDKISGNRFTGMGVGTVVTAVVQSSSATTVMVVGFVNAGVMTLMQAAPIIMGANIGTTITTQIVALESLKITVYLASLTCIGSFMMIMSKKDNIKSIGVILAGLGMIFVGLNVMSTSMNGFKQMEEFIDFFKNTTNPFLLLLIGLSFTALVQSSSATSSIVVLLAGQGVLPLQSAMYICLGINIGTCVTAMLASIGTSPNAKRAAVIHLLFNVIGVVIFLPVVAFFKIDWLIEKMFSTEQTQVAMFHTLFNILTTLLMIPFVNVIVKMATFLIKDKKPQELYTSEFVPNKLKHMDNLILNTPAIAINQFQKEILTMAEIANKNFEISIDSILNINLDKKEEFDKSERQLNFYNKELTKMLVKLTTLEISFKDEIMLSSFYHVISDIERVGDYAENIMEYTAELKESDSIFSDDAKEEIKEMVGNISNVYEWVIKTFVSKDISMIDEVCKYEDKVDECKKRLGIQHIKRLNLNICSAKVGAVFLSLTSNLERISDHWQNIAMSIKDYTRAPKKVKAEIKKQNN